MLRLHALNRLRPEAENPLIFGPSFAARNSAPRLLDASGVLAKLQEGQCHVSHITGGRGPELT
jgi:hypothetical protein